MHNILKWELIDLPSTQTINSIIIARTLAIHIHDGTLELQSTQMLLSKASTMKVNP